MRKCVATTSEKILLIGALFLAGCLSQTSSVKSPRTKAPTAAATPAASGGGSTPLEGEGEEEDARPVAALLTGNAIMTAMGEALRLKVHYTSLDPYPQYDTAAGHIFTAFDYWQHLPTTGTAEDMTLGKVLAIKKISLAVCNSIYAKESRYAYNDAQRRYFLGIDFSRALSTITVEERKTVLGRFGVDILGKGLSEAQVSILLGLLRDVQADISPQGLPHLPFWSAPCIVLLNSISFLEG